MHLTEGRAFILLWVWFIYRFIFRVLQGKKKKIPRKQVGRGDSSRVIAYRRIIEWPGLK